MIRIAYDYNKLYANLFTESEKISSVKFDYRCQDLNEFINYINKHSSNKTENLNIFLPVQILDFTGFRTVFLFDKVNQNNRWVFIGTEQQIAEALNCHNGMYSKNINFILLPQESSFLIFKIVEQLNVQC